MNKTVIGSTAFESPTRNIANFELPPSKTNQNIKANCFRHKLRKKLPSATELKQYTSALLCGLLIWGTSSFLLKEVVLPGGYIFNMAAAVALGYVFGHTLERYTTINPVVGMTLVGALYRNFIGDNFLEDPVADVIDYHLRRVYPVIILTRGPLGWNWEYIRNNPFRVFSLATVPWVVECLAVAVFTHVLLGFAWYWGLHLGAILASVSPAVVVPTCLALSTRGLGAKNNIALLVANAGGLDTAFTEGMFGVINSAIFYPAPPYYRIVKGIFAIFIGIVIGILWGIMLDNVPDHVDPYAPTARSALIFFGGLFISYAGGYYGWGGTSGVAIMVCAGTAATRWSRRGWPINANPVSEVYKLLWRIFEPMLFTLSGYYLEFSSITLEEFGLIMACVMLALMLRLVTAFLVSLANELSVKESLFITVTWIPKAIVEAVLVRVASDSLWTDGSTTLQDRRAARMHSNIIVIAILLTSTLGSALTTSLGPILLAQDSRVAPEDKILEGISDVDNDVYSVSKDREVKTTVDISKYFTGGKHTIEDEKLNKKENPVCLEAPDVTHYFTLAILGLLSWGLLWSTFGDGWRLDGPWCRIAAVALIAWSSGLALQAATALPPMLAALLTGILARNLNFLDMRDFVEIDSFLRRIYPVIILGKASLGWDLSFMKMEWKRVLSLGVLPWAAEVSAVACCTNLLLGFPWLWGTLLGSIYASVSCAVVMPSVTKHQQGGEAMRRRNWPQLVCTAGGVDTLLSVGVYGIIFSYIFSDVDPSYKYFKAALTLLFGITLGIAWGSLAKFTPHRDDFYLTELRVLFLMLGELFGNFFTLFFGWGGVGGVAVLACNATAARGWSQQGWKLNKNPAATAYRVLWSALEPMVFAYSGTFLKVDKATGNTMLLGLGILFICLLVRLAVTWLVCWDFTTSEKLYICCTWIPKSIVEAVLCPVAITALLTRPEDSQLEYAEDLLRLIVQAIIITTPIGFLLTEHLGPKLLAHADKMSNESDLEEQKRNSVHSEVQNNNISAVE